MIRPLHGLQVENLYEADLSVLEQMVKVGVPERCGVIVVKVWIFHILHFSPVLMFLIQCRGCELFAIVISKLCLRIYPVGLSFAFMSAVANKKLSVFCVFVLQVQEPSTELSEIKVGEIITHVDGVPFSNAAEVCTILTLCGVPGLSKMALNIIVFWY